MGACRRRKSPTKRRQHLHPGGSPRGPPLEPMAPRSFEHQVYISLARSGHRLAFVSRGLISYFMTRLEGISNFCAIYSLTGMLFTAFAGTMIKNQPLFIKGINEHNQELTKESAFGAMGMFIFLFSSSVIYLCCHKSSDDEHAIRSQGYMRPHFQSAGGQRLSEYQVELSHSGHGLSESAPDLLGDPHEDDHEEVDLLS